MIRHALWLLLVPALAFGQAVITVDGADADWANVTSCFPPPGSNSNGMNFTRLCVENDVVPMTSGNLYGLFVSDSPPPKNNNNLMYGFFIDTDGNSQLATGDMAFGFHFTSGATVSDQLYVLTASNKQSVATYNAGQSCDANPADIWSARRSADQMHVEVSIPLGCLKLQQTCRTYYMMMLGAYPSAGGTPLEYYSLTEHRIVQPTSSTPDVKLLTSLANDSRTDLYWTLPGLHDGTLIVRSTAPLTGAPAQGASYAVGDSIGNGQVVADLSYCEQHHADTGLTNGTTYYYKVFNYDENRNYSSGFVPTPNGITATPLSGSGTPVWCYNTGFFTSVQPSIDRGRGVFSSGNVGAVIALDTGGTPDGNERFRPYQLAGAVQDRFPVVPFEGRSGNYLLTGDQTGHAYAISAQSGNILWQGNAGAPLGTSIQAYPVLQLYSYADSVFQAANANPFPRDLTFFATRNAGSNNAVYALNSWGGSTVAAYAPGDLGMINGGMSVDYANDRLWLGAKGTGSLRVISTIPQGNQLAEVARFSLGDISFPIAHDYATNEAYVVDDNGVVYGFDWTSMTQLWSLPVGKLNTYVFPTGGGFLASLASGSVNFYSVTSVGATLVWSVPVPGPEGLFIDYAAEKIFVGSTDGSLHQIDFISHTDEKQLPIVSPGTVFAPTIDSTLHRLYVGTSSGKICSVAEPF